MILYCGAVCVVAAVDVVVVVVAIVVVVVLLVSVFYLTNDDYGAFISPYPTVAVFVAHRVWHCLRPLVLVAN